VTCVLIVVKG